MLILSLDRILLELESRWWFYCCPRGSCSMGLHEFAWAHNSWMRPLSTSLNFFARTLVTGPIGTWTRSFEAVPWSPSHLDPMIIIELRTKGIKFERHKEEFLISSQFLKNQKKSKALPFLIFIPLIYMKNVYRFRWLLRAP